MPETNIDTTETQQYLLEILLANPKLYVRIQNLFNPRNYNTELQETAKYIKEYSEQYSKLPDYKQIVLTTGVTLSELEPNEDYTDWFLDTYEKFARQKEIVQAINDSIDLIEKGELEQVESLITNASRIGLVKDMGLNYFADPKARLLNIKENNGQTSTGWKELDDALYGGFNKGELQIFAGLPGSGKSLFLQNLGINWIKMRMNGIYITLELSQDLTSMRWDSMITGVPSCSIFKEIDDVDYKVRTASKTCGQLQVKYMPSQSTVNDIRTYIHEFRIQGNPRPDFVCIDYLDLLMPATVKVPPSDLFVRDKYISEEMRNLAGEMGLLMATASQFNRSGVDEGEFDYSHIAGGISKINTGDNVFGIFTSRAMREKGKYQLQLMKTRSSAGVGNKVNLAFNTKSLRITDAPTDSNKQSTMESLNDIKRNANVKPISEQQEDMNTTLRNKLKEMSKY